MRRAATHAQAPGQLALGAQAAVDAGHHRVGHAPQMRVRRLVRIERPLVRPHDFGDAQARLLAHAQQLGGRAKRERHRRPRRRRPAQLGLPRDEPAADRAPALGEQLGPGRVGGGEGERVRVLRRRGEAVEDQVRRRIEGNFRAAGQAQAPGRGDRGHQRVGGIGIHRVRRMARETEDHRLVGAVAASGPGERAEQRDRDPRHPPEQVGTGEVGHERAGGLHRPDRVRGGGADADLEQVAGTDHRPSA